MKPLLILLFILHSAAGFGQRHTDRITKEIEIQNNPAETILYVANINGNIVAEAYEGNTITVEASREIQASTDEKLQKGISDFGLATLDRGDTIYLYLSGICGSENFLHSSSGNRNYYTEDCRQDFDFSMDMTIRVPADLNIYLSTINDGQVEVRNVMGTLDLHNVNGPVRAEGVEAAAIARTINGDVDIDFNKKPDSGSFYSLNGNITMLMPKGFSAKATFKSYNGDIYTNVEQVSQEPVMRKEASSKKGTTFRAEVTSMITFRNGGGILEIETFNGDAYIKEK